MIIEICEDSGAKKNPSCSIRGKEISFCHFHICLILHVQLLDRQVSETFSTMPWKLPQIERNLAKTTKGTFIWHSRCLHVSITVTRVAQSICVNKVVALIPLSFQFNFMTLSHSCSSYCLLQIWLFMIKVKFNRCSPWKYHTCDTVILLLIHTC